jgi:hypothetical protein
MPERYHVWFIPEAFDSSLDWNIVYPYLSLSRDFLLCLQADTGKYLEMSVFIYL